MKSLLLEKKSKFILYVMACFLPVITQLMQIGVVALIFETVERNSMTFFWNAVFLAAVFLVLSTLFYITSRMMRISYMRDVLLSLRIKAFDNIMSMSYKQFNKKSRDVYVSHLINDINTFESSFFISLINFIFRCGLYISVLIILTFVNWIIALVVFGLSLTLFLVSMLYGKKTVKMQKQVSVANEEFTTDVSNTFTGLEILKLNNIEAIFLKKNHDQIAKLESRKFKFNIFTAFQLYSNVTIGFIFFMGLLVYLMYLTKDGLGFGEIVLTIQLSSSALFPLVTMMPLINILKSSKAIYEKITKTDEEADLNHKDKPFVFKNRIDLDQVSFGYENQMLFKSTSFSIEKGKKYLVKGPSGSGKTTLFKLLSMALDDYTGKILVDGTDMKTIMSKSFNEKVSYVYQDVFLFEATLKENIALFKETSDQAVHHAIKQAGLSEFVNQLPDGIHTQISENGKNLSGGERQRVSIARALFKQADILFVDEATSSLNDELGVQIEQTLLSLDATILAISHKTFPGVTKTYDFVLELKDGYVTTYAAEDYFAEVTQ